MSPNYKIETEPEYQIQIPQQVPRQMMRRQDMYNMANNESYQHFNQGNAAFVGSVYQGSELQMYNTPQLAGSVMPQSHMVEHIPMQMDPSRTVYPGGSMVPAPYINYADNMCPQVMPMPMAIMTPANSSGQFTPNIYQQPINTEEEDEEEMDEECYDPRAYSSSSSSSHFFSPVSSYQPTYGLSLMACNNAMKNSSMRSPRETKAWTNPLVVPGGHVRLMSKNAVRMEKALPGKKGNYFCSHCSEQFRTIMELAEHMDLYSVRRSFHCTEEDCPWNVLGFATASEWSRHTRSQHGSVTLTMCTICNKPFTRKDSLKRHLQLVHENQDSRYNRKMRGLTIKKQKSVSR